MATERTSKKQSARKPSRKWLAITLMLIVAAVVAAISAAALAAKQFRESDRIADNVTIQGVDVSNLTAAEAAAAVSQEWAARLPSQVSLTWPGGKVRKSPEQLGARLRIKTAVSRAMRIAREGGFTNQIMTRVRLIRDGVDIPVRVEVDESVVEARLIDLVPEINREPRNADISVDGDVVNVIPGRTGLELDVEKSTAALVTALKDPSLESFKLITRVQQPAIRAADLKHLEVVLASYTTRFRSWQKDRTHNLRLAINNLARAVIMPGDTFSFNERIGPRLSEQGWRAAPIFIDGEVEPSTGGGICQVATTVYNAALLANLDTVERHHHSRPVDYAPAGRDATVYWGQYDLRIRNQLRHPVLIIGSIGDSSLTIKVLGARSDKYDVEIERSGEQTIPHTTKEIKDPELEEGKREVEKPGRNGKRVTVTRIVRKNGKTVATERLHTDTYSPQAEVVRIGAKPKEEPAVTTPDGQEINATAPGQPAAAQPGKPAQPSPSGKPGAPAKPPTSPKPAGIARPSTPAKPVPPDED